MEVKEANPENREDYGEAAIKKIKLDNSEECQVKVNAMLIPLVLEKIFSYFKNSLPNLKNFRHVCKTWDNEVIRIIRNKSSIDLTNIVSLKYDARRDAIAIGEGTQLRLESQPDVPFENIRLHGSCEILKNGNMIKWFQTMGSTVKELHFISSLNCYHQIRFLECVLKIWCQNLTTLYLSGVKSFIFFTQFSRFDGNPFICQVKNLIISSDVDEEVREGNELVDCEKLLDLEKTFLNFNESGGKRIKLDRIDTELSHTINFFYYEIFRSLAYRLEEDETTHIRLFKASGADGGILGELLQKCDIEKLVIKNLPNSTNTSLIQALCLKPKSVKTIKVFQYENFVLFSAAPYYRALQELSLPLTKICFGPILLNAAPHVIVVLIGSLKDTLLHLEFSGTIVLRDYVYNDNEDEFINLSLPILPNLHTFINGNIFCTRVGGLDFVLKMPKLQKCSLTNAIYHSSIFPLNPSQVFNLLFQSSNFEDTQHEFLEELKLDGKISFTRHLELLRDWFPGLKKLDLILDGSDIFVEFFVIMKKLELRDVKLSFHSNDNSWCNASIANNMRKMKELRFLELIHLDDHPLVLSAMACEDGFAAAPKLTSLKLENFGMYADEIEVIRNHLRRISLVKFTKSVIQYRPVDAEFSVGNIVPFPSMTSTNEGRIEETK